MAPEWLSNEDFGFTTESFRKINDELERMLHSDSRIRNAAEKAWTSRTFDSQHLYLLVVYACCRDFEELIDLVESVGATQASTTNSIKDLHMSGAGTTASAFPFQFKQEEPPHQRDEHTALEYAQHLARRQLVILLVKRLIKAQWTGVEKACQDMIKEKLLATFLRLPRLIRLTSGTIIGLIAKYDGSIAAKWPQMVPTIRYFLDQCYNNHCEPGIVASLELLSDVLVIQAEQNNSIDSAGESESTVGEDLLNLKSGIQITLLQMAQGMQRFDIAKQKPQNTLSRKCRRSCIRIYRQALTRVVSKLVRQSTYSRLESIGENFFTEEASTFRDVCDHQKSMAVRQFLDYNVTSEMSQWLKVLDGMLAELLDCPTDLELMQTGLAALTCYRKLVEVASLVGGKYQSTLGMHLTEVIPKILFILQDYYAYYESMVINEAITDGEIEELDDGGPASFVMQTTGLLMAMLEDNETQHHVMENLRNILCSISLYVQITDAQLNSWLKDPSEFITIEDSMGHIEMTPRRALQVFILRSLTRHEDESKKSLMDASSQLIALAKKKSQDASPRMRDRDPWWKLVEVGLWLIGVAAERGHLDEALEQRTLQSVAATIGSILSGQGSELLRARALWTAVRLSSFLVNKHPGDVETILNISAENLKPQYSLPLRVSACKTLMKFTPICSNVSTREKLLQRYDVMNSLIDFLSSEIDAVLHLAMGALKVLLHESPGAFKDLLPDGRKLSAVLAGTWTEKLSDPVIGQSIVDFAAECRYLREPLKVSLANGFLTMICQLLRPWKAVSEPYECRIALELLEVIYKLSWNWTDSSGRQFDALTKTVNLLSVIEDSLTIRMCCRVLGVGCQLYRTRIASRAYLFDRLTTGLLKLFQQKVDDTGLAELPAFLQHFLRLFGQLLNWSTRQQLITAMTKRCIETESPHLQSALILAICRYICENPGAMTDCLDSVLIDIDGRFVSGLDLIVIFICTSLSQADKGIPQKQYDRHVVLFATLCLLQECGPRLERVKTAKNIPEYLLRFLIEGLRVLVREQDGGHLDVFEGASTVANEEQGWLPSEEANASSIRDEDIDGRDLTFEDFRSSQEPFKCSSHEHVGAIHEDISRKVLAAIDDKSGEITSSRYFKDDFFVIAEEEDPFYQVNMGALLTKALSSDLSSQYSHIISQFDAEFSTRFVDILEKAQVVFHPLVS